MMAKPKVYITRPDIGPEGIEKLKAECDVETFGEERPMTKNELIQAIKGKNALLCMLTDLIDKEVLDAAGEDLKVIATMSVGYEHIDLKECKNRNIPVSNTPKVSTEAVAEWTVLLMLAAGRNFIESATAIKDGKWEHAWSPSWLCGQGLVEATVGIIGMGQIGRAIMDRILPFGIKQVIYYDVMHPIKPAEEKGAVFVEMEELLRKSDFIVSMTNLTDETRNLFNKKAFDKMKENCCFINTSRGGVVNQEDLYEALKSKTIRCAALDVTNPEPLPKDHQLLTLPNIIITPHIASAEAVTRKKMSNLAAENILAGLKGETLKTPINIPA